MFYDFQLVVIMFKQVKNLVDLTKKLGALIQFWLSIGPHFNLILILFEDAEY